MNKSVLSRRAFLASVVSAARTSAVVLTLPMILNACGRAQQSRLLGEDFRVLTVEEATEFDAIAARIIPTDETPGAREAGAVYFMDHVLADNRNTELAALREGLAALQQQVATQYGADRFSSLGPDTQDKLLSSIESGQFFLTLRYLTIAGMFSLPEYGGNRNNVGYQVIGLDSHGAWTAPYGHYDADFMAKGE